MIRKIERTALTLSFGFILGTLGGLLLAPRTCQESREALQLELECARARMRGKDEPAGIGDGV